ncbi:SRPBCC domain-containing protein [Novosphingobium sp.]|uniref:SRPBCC domain-containing protein n=1 Tax=Novosphingobium sp. TaxID=1874826 RepID=UPI0025EDCFE7|nr:SRPBCC domain-containing protein [Novosphingobium sp.]
MGHKSDGQTGAGPNPTTADRVSDRELVITRMVDAPPAAVYAAWSRAELFRKWWVPQSLPMKLLSCEMDVRTGGAYRLEFGHPDFDQPMAFFGTYLDVEPGKRMVWTNAESEEGAVTTVTFADKGGKTLLTISNLFPSKDACDAEIASGATAAMDETLAQLDALLAAAGTPLAG